MWKTRNYVSLLELLIISAERFKVTLIPFSIPDFPIKM